MSLSNDLESYLPLKHMNVRLSPTPYSTGCLQLLTYPFVQNI